MKIFPKRNYPDNRLIIFMIVLLGLNTVLLVLNFNISVIRSSQERETLAVRQELAKELMDYNRKLAKDMDVINRTSVREALANYNYEIDLAQSSDELARAIFSQGHQVQETILREWDSKLRERVLVQVNLDETVQELQEPLQLTLRFTDQGGLDVDPEHFLTDQTRQEIIDIFTDSPSHHDQVFSIEIEEGKGKIMVPYNPLDYIQTLTEEIDSLRVTLHDLRVNTGLAELSGKGVCIKLYDSYEGYTSSDIIHDADVRDVVNELFASGAKAVAVGGQRLIATSPIRCVGPLIKVNEKKITVNPVVIEAIGDPEVLASGLDIIKFQLEFHRNFQVSIEKTDQLTLPGYSRN